MTAYLASRGDAPGPFFQFNNGEQLTKEFLVKHLRDSLTNAGIDASIFSGHSFHIGEASTAVALGVEDSLIKTLSQWKSSAYLLYVRILRKKLALMSHILAQ